MSSQNVLHFRSNEIRYIFLFVTSIVLVIWQHFGMTTFLAIVPDISDKIPLIFHSDLINGGKSNTKLSQENHQIRLDCNIILSDTFAFCGVTIPLVNKGQAGINLQRYSQMQIDLEYLSAKDDTLLIYLNNEELSRGQKTIEKANMWAVSPARGINHFTLSPNRFFIPSWWVFQNANQGIRMQPDITNIKSISITTGDNPEARDVSIFIHKIQFNGKWIAADELYLGLLITWLLLISAHGLVYLRKLSINYNQSKEHNAYLSKLNEFLSIQKSQFETMAKKDKLTGAWNRAGVRDFLQTITEKYKRNGQASTLISLDIDHFKKVNDTFGHDTGDDVLKQIVKLINENTREDDHLARWGGEEFQLLCPDTKLNDGNILAETLRVKIMNAQFAHGQSITCSFGVAELKDEEIKTWFKRADIALYQAKDAGRNCVIISH